jgi:hypothetical protein
MPDISNDSAETFVLEPETQLDGSPAPARTWPRPLTWRASLAAPAWVALAEGVALLGCFLLLPWAAFPTVGAGEPGPNPPRLDLYTGWDAARGLRIGPRLPFDFFVHLWLVPLVAVLLLVLEWMTTRLLLTARLELGSVLAL